MSKASPDPIDAPTVDAAITNTMPPDKAPLAAGVTNPEPPVRQAWRLDWRFLVLVVIAGAAIPVWRAVTIHATPHTKTAASTPMSVSVAPVTREDLVTEVTIQAEFRPYVEVELHAKVSGYLDKINVDFGDQVKAGQVVAQLEIPELRDELEQARAAQQRAEADYWNAHLSFTRIQKVLQKYPNGVAQQELDTADAKDRTTSAALAAAKADVEKLETMLAYTRITAPFDGVITRRFVDPGVLIQAGTASSTQSLPLVCLSDNYRLRLDFPVSIAYVKDVRLGSEVEVKVESLGGKTLTGKITRCADKVDDATRTMITEVEVPNPKLEIVPGMYATAGLKVNPQPHALAIPTEAVSGGQKPTVYVVDVQHRIQERPVTLGLETPTKYQVLDGLREGELVLVGSRSRIHVGQSVEPKLVGALAKE